mgnify:CR=1 FL=1
MYNNQFFVIFSENTRFEEKFMSTKIVDLIIFYKFEFFHFSINTMLNFKANWFCIMGCVELAMPVVC